MSEITVNAGLIAKELLETAEENQILVVGCSTSEVAGEKIGTASSLDIAAEIYEGIKEAADEKKVYIAAQCCEHLNRCLIIEKEAADKYGFEIVSVRPAKKAGGSFGTTCYENFKEPCAVEFIKADFGMDIGNTLIGMHLKHVAVPFRPSVKTIGGAYVVCARVRPKYIGGERAQY
ncbi:MAG: TIGR01440 family protein [Bacillota bacterium]|nr:TIGR01440 family protein [Bacillota bacterium]